MVLFLSALQRWRFLKGAISWYYYYYYYYYYYKR